MNVIPGLVRVHLEVSSFPREFSEGAIFSWFCLRILDGSVSVFLKLDGAA